MNDNLKNAVNLFSDFFEVLRYPVAVIDKEGKYIYYNIYDAEIDKSSVKDNLGKYILDSYKNLTEETSTMLRSLKHGERFIDKHQIYITKTGKTVDYMHTTLPLYDENKNIIGAIEIGRDISQIKQLTDTVLDLSAKLYTHYEENPNQLEGQDEILTRNEKMISQINKLDIYSQTDFPILIYGETGTGKELFSKRAHKKSKRANKPFVTLNCAGIPDTLLESMLFGTEKGAFTGAEKRKGLFEIADGGTLFLDELNSMPMNIQPKLLRVLQDGTFLRLGSNQQIHVDVRIIAAMNQSPEEAIEKGALRRDLFYRISTCMISIPPLRHRKEDISLLAYLFLEKYSKELGHNLKHINPQVINRLEQNSWPGNVRMLENVIKRSIMLEDKNHIALNDLVFDMGEEIFSNKIEPNDSPNDTITPIGSSLTEMVDNYEKEIIEKAMIQYKNNIKRAAEALKIPRSTLQYKLLKYDIKTAN
ncbi:sigma 54-interacting transcriptional regulator [Clostridium sp. JN-1]|uniref:sigma-54 interaction domain-containing protein n=1 Tax=Clostridium sp. JN-1 TaxID=2483110 RepID=UPI000F0BD01D|nr:sigma 54-interacting transcriptional regulator [Clostridium sp. JN-1]